MGSKKRVARRLIDKGAPLDAKNFRVDGDTPLHLASKNGHTEVARLLIEKGAPLDAKNFRVDGDTPLHLASKNGHTDVAKLLIEKGAEVDATNKMGRTPLHLASKKRVARLLIEKARLLSVHRMATELSRTFETKFKEVGTVVEAASTNETKKMQKQMAEMHKAMMEGPSSSGSSRR